MKNIQNRSWSTGNSRQSYASANKYQVHRSLSNRIPQSADPGSVDMVSFSKEEEGDTDLGSACGDDNEGQSQQSTSVYEQDAPVFGSTIQS